MFAFIYRLIYFYKKEHSIVMLESFFSFFLTTVIGQKYFFWPMKSQNVRMSACCQNFDNCTLELNEERQINLFFFIAGI